MDTTLFYHPTAVAALPMAPSEAALPLPLAPPAPSSCSNGSNPNNPSPPCTPANQLHLLSHKHEGNIVPTPVAPANLVTPRLPSAHAYPTPCLSQPQQQQQQSTAAACPPRVQVQPLSFPRDRMARPTMFPVTIDCSSASGATAPSAVSTMDPKLAKANFVDSLVDTATVVIESIWPPPSVSQSTSTSSLQQQQHQKALPLRTFVQETLKRSRSSYSTLQTALYYLYKIRNKVPSEFLKRRNNQLYYNYQILSAQAAGLATPPPSPMHLHTDTFTNATATSTSTSATASTDYFSARTAVGGVGGNHNSINHQSTLPSPMSTSSNASMSPPDSNDSSSSSSPASSDCSSTTTSPPPTSASVSNASPTPQQQQQCNKILYCGRRTFLAALMVASKYLQDRNYSNKAWAKISGLSIKEINANELVFLKLIDYSLFVSHETFMRWTALLLAHGQEATRRFMQSADAASAAAIALRVRHQQQLHSQGHHHQYPQQHQHHQQHLHHHQQHHNQQPRTLLPSTTRGSSNSVNSKQGDRGMSWTATHSRPSEEQLQPKQHWKQPTQQPQQDNYSMLPPHLALTPPDHADEAYPSTSTSASAITITKAPPAASTTAAAIADSMNEDTATVVLTETHAGSKRRRDSDCQDETSNKSIKACEMELNIQEQDFATATSTNISSTTTAATAAAATATVLGFV